MSLPAVQRALLLLLSRHHSTCVKRCSTLRKMELGRRVASKTPSRKFIARLASWASLRDFKLAFFIRCQRRLFAGRHMNSSNTCWIERKSKSRWQMLSLRLLLPRRFRLRLTTINLQSNLYTSFYKKKRPVPVSIPQIHRRHCRIRGNFPRCQTASFMLTLCTKKIIIGLRIWQISDRIHNFTHF
jgi:hypothetical protein